jgi:hypothetical protein
MKESIETLREELLLKNEVLAKLENRERKSDEEMTFYKK